MSKDQGIQISFDEECRIRVLDPEQFKHSEALEEECRGFVEKIGDFNKSVNHIINLLQENGARIDKEKLRAIGDRNKVVIYYTCKCLLSFSPGAMFRNQKPCHAFGYLQYLRREDCRTCRFDHQ